MDVPLEHAVERTVQSFDQLGAMWGRDRRLSVSVHNLPHDEIHKVVESEIVYPSESDPTVTVLIGTLFTRFGWTMAFYGRPDLADCERCCAIVYADEAAQIAGVVE